MEDVEELQSVAKDRNFNCVFSDDRYEFESTDDVLEHKGPLIKELDAEFTKKGSAESIRIRFGRSLVLMSTDGVSNEIKALELEFDSILSTHKTSIHLIRSPYFWGGMFSGILTAAGMTVLVVGITEFVRVFKPFNLAFSILVLFAFLYSITNWVNYPAIFLDRQHKRSTFWRRDGDRIILLLFGTVVGLFVKMLYDHLSQ